MSSSRRTWSVKGSVFLPPNRHDYTTGAAMIPTPRILNGRSGENNARPETATGTRADSVIPTQDCRPRAAPRLRTGDRNPYLFHRARREPHERNQESIRRLRRSFRCEQSAATSIRREKPAAGLMPDVCRQAPPNAGPGNSGHSSENMVGLTAGMTAAMAKCQG
jgi:hypothetical protein